MNASERPARPRLWILRALGRGALVRRHDRIEALVTMLVLLTLIAAVPKATLAGQRTPPRRDRTEPGV